MSRGIFGFFKILEKETVTEIRTVCQSAARGAGGMDVSVFLDRSGVVPHGAMWASPPTLGTSVFFVGADALIGPGRRRDGRVCFFYHSKDTPGGAMWASPPTLGTSVFFVGADAHIGPGRRRDGRVRFYNHSKDTPGGAMWASPPTLGTSVFSQICKSGRQKCRPFMRIYS